MAKVKLNGGEVAKTKRRNPQIEFDRLQMYFGEPYVIDEEDTAGTITVYQPTIGDVVEIGEKTFYSTLNIFIANTTSYRLPLWEAGVDWNEISDFELFLMIYKSIEHKASKLIFGDLDFSLFEPYQKKDGTIVLYNPEEEIEINEKVYQRFSQYLQNAFNIFPEEKITSDYTMKSWFINKDRRQIANDKEKEKNGTKENTSILPLISSCVNHPGFKYNVKELKEVGVCQFYDSVKRLQIYESATACMKGLYSGFVDAKHINSDDYNFMKEL